MLIASPPTSLKKWILVDGYGIFLRYFYAVQRDFVPSNHAVFLILRKIAYLKNKFNPYAIIWVFEKGAKVHKSYDKNYKKDRAKFIKRMEPIRKKYQLENQLQRLRQYIANLNYCWYFISEGDEGDTVIAEMTRQLIEKDKNNEIFIFSFDNDFWQLLAYPQVRLIWKNGAIIDFNNYEKYIKTFRYVPPASYPLYKAIKGDRVDNIKGIDGIGDKTLEKIFYSAWFEKRYLKTPDDLFNYLIDSKFLPEKYKQKLLTNFSIIKKNMPLVDLLNIELLSLSGRVKIKEFLNNLENMKKIKKYDVNQLLQEDNFKSLVGKL